MSEIKEIDNKYYLVIKSKRYGEVKYLIDAEDVKRISLYKWSVAKRHHGIYAYCNEKYAIIEERLLHRFIANCPKEKVIDHINHDTLDNRKENLRICTYTENNQNIRHRKNSKNKFRFITKVKETNRKQKYYINIQNKLRCRCYNLISALLARDIYLRYNDEMLYNLVSKEEYFQEQLEDYDDEEEEE